MNLDLCTHKKKEDIHAVFCPYWGTSNPYQDELAESLEQHRVKVQKSESLKKAFHDIILLRRRPDIVHLHWLPSFDLGLLSLLRLFAFVLRLSLLRLLGLKIVWTVHNLIPHEAKHYKINHLVGRFIATVANGIIVHGESARKMIISAWHINRHQKIFVIPHGNYIDQYANNIDSATARQSLGISASNLIMLFLGGIRPYKGVLELVEAFKSLSENETEAELIIVGRPLSKEFSSAIKARIGTYKGIQYKPGFVPKDEIQVYMNASDVVVFPYQEILTSGAVILAMSFGRACIAPKRGCIQDVLDSKGAFMYEASDKNGLINALKAVCDNRENLIRMGQHNLQKVLQWSWHKVAQETAEVYCSCLNKMRKEKILGQGTV